jgi:hypothetical protein
VDVSEQEVELDPTDPHGGHPVTAAERRAA